MQRFWENDIEPVPVEGWKVLLDEADQMDDRVWLGKVRLAILTSRFDEARTWLHKCLERRPDDTSVRFACVDLAVATDDIGRFWDATAQSQPRLSAPWRSGTAPWLVSRTGDPQAERRELARLIELQPANSRALERLAVLARSGRLERGEKLSRTQSGDRPRLE